jgi:hypothetical protein
MTTVKNDWALNLIDWESCNEEFLKATLMSPNGNIVTFTWVFPEIDPREAKQPLTETFDKVEKMFSENPEKLFEILEENEW